MWRTKVIDSYTVLLRCHCGAADNIGVERPEISMRDFAGRLIPIARDRFGYSGHLVIEAAKYTDYLIAYPNRR